MREKPIGKENNWRWEFRGRKLVLEMGKIPLGKKVIGDGNLEEGNHRVSWSVICCCFCCVIGVLIQNIIVCL